MHFGIYNVFYTQNFQYVSAILRKLACQFFTHWTSLEALPA